MNLTHLQRDCLDKMGILLYEKTSLKHLYWIGIEKPLSKEEQVLLSKMLIALHWPESKCKISCHLKDFPLNHENSIKGMMLIDAISPQMDMLIQTYPNVIKLPSLQTLLNNVSEKRLAWGKMQKLIE